MYVQYLLIGISLPIPAAFLSCCSVECLQLVCSYNPYFIKEIGETDLQIACTGVGGYWVVFICKHYSANYLDLRDIGA